MPIDIPRDRDGSFEPELVKKGPTRIDGGDDKIIGLYAAGLSTRDISSHLEEVFGLQVSADLFSRITDAVLEGVFSWQNRALEPRIPLFSSMPCGSKSATRKAVRLETRQLMWREALRQRANARFWACVDRGQRRCQILAFDHE